MAARKNFNDQNESFSVNHIYTYIENYQIWAADVDRSWGELLFEIDIVGQQK